MLFKREWTIWIQRKMGHRTAHTENKIDRNSGELSEVSSSEEMNVMDVKREDLTDIDTVQVDKMDSIEKKMNRLVSTSGGDPFTHLNGEYVVRVHFGKEGYTATDALKHYLRQMAELKY